MNPKKISFIICADNDSYLQECQLYIRSLHIPDGYTVNILPVCGAASMAAGYNTAMLQSDAKYKVYLHQDVFVLNQNFLFDSLSIFQDNPKIGMIGMVGTKRLPDNGCMWSTKMRTGALRSCPLHTTDDYFDLPVPAKRGYTPVQAIDGLLMMTQYDVLWRSDLFTGWDFYDVSQSLEFAKAGYRIAVPYQESPWVLHDCGFMNLEKYHDYRRLLLEEYFPEHTAAIADCKDRIAQRQEAAAGGKTASSHIVPKQSGQTAAVNTLLTLLEDRRFSEACAVAQEKRSNCHEDETFCILSILLQIYQAELATGTPEIFYPLRTKPADWLPEHYRNIKRYLWRIENDLPPEAQREGTRYFQEQRVSPTARSMLRRFCTVSPQ